MVKATGQHHLMPAGILKPCPWERPVDNEAMLNTQHLYKHTAFWRNLKSLAAHFTIWFVESAEHLVRSAVTSRVANKKNKGFGEMPNPFFMPAYCLKKQHRTYFAALIRQTVFPASSAISTPPCLSLARPTGKPRTCFSSSVRKPETTVCG